MSVGCSVTRPLVARSRRPRKRGQGSRRGSPKTTIEGDSANITGACRGTETEQWTDERTDGAPLHSLRFAVAAVFRCFHPLVRATSDSMRIQARPSVRQAAHARHPRNLWSKVQRTARPTAAPRSKEPRLVQQHLCRTDASPRGRSVGRCSGWTGRATTTRPSLLCVGFLGIASASR